MQSRTINKKIGMKEIKIFIKECLLFQHWDREIRCIGGLFWFVLLTLGSSIWYFYFQ